MISGVGSIAVLVKDAKLSAEWYREKLGFDVIGNIGHGVFVAPRGSHTPLIHLCGPCDAWEGDQPGGRTGIWLSCSDVALRKNEKTGRVIPASLPDEVERTYQELRSRGVEFAEDLETAAWGRYAVFKDPDGNLFEIS